MKQKLQMTGENIAAAVLVLSYFFTWVTLNRLTASGLTLTTASLSPGLWSDAINGSSRMLFLLLILVPASGAFILWQNYSPDTKYAQYIKPAHWLPLPAIIIPVFVLYKNITDALEGLPLIDTPSFFDIASAGFYLSFLSALYLLLITAGKVRDKNFSKQTPEKEPSASSSSQVNIIAIKTTTYENAN